VGQVEVARRLLAAAWAALRAGHWSRDELQRYWSACLRELVRHAWSATGYDRRRLQAAGLDWRDIRGTDDLARIPLVRRSDLGATRPDGLLAARVNRASLVTRRASGTSGYPLTVHRTPAEERLLQAFRQTPLSQIWRRGFGGFRRFGQPPTCRGCQLWSVCQGGCGAERQIRGQCLRDVWVGREHNVPDVAPTH
jgi:radical SAM protein with 4Fe4S-binding SPASM domain